MHPVKMSLLRSSLLASLLTLAWAGLAAAQPAPAAAPAGQAITFSVVSASSVLSYDVVHKLHKVHGMSKKVEGKARLLPDGKVQVMVRVPVESFDSSNVNRDAHMKEVVEAAKFPQIEIKATADGVVPPQNLPATIDKTFKAQINFHGVQKTLDLPVKLSFESNGSVRAQVAVSLSLEEFKIERPSLMFVKVNDDMQIQADIVFAKG